MKLYNAIQAQAAQHKPIRIIILKARQLGFSTLVESLIFQRTTNKSMINSLIVAHKEESTNNLFNMSKLFYEMLPPGIKPMRKASNSRELIFENPTKDLTEKYNNPGLRSKIKCATAGGEGVGRSDTLQNVHVSEYAFWDSNKKETLNGIMQSVPNTENTMVIIESTANGYDHFKELWDMAVSGDSDFVPVFFAWFENPLYRMAADNDFKPTEEEQELINLYNLDSDQITWRRWAIKNNCLGDINLFKQEYPSCPEEAFITTGRPVFDNDAIVKRIEYLRQNPDIQGVGYLKYEKDQVVFIEDPKGPLTIYQYPIENYPYTIGADVAEGLISGDADAAQILNNMTLEQVAVYHNRLNVDLYADDLVKLGKFYNIALLSPEVNFNPGLVLNLERLQYGRIYVRQHLDTMTKKFIDVLGWRTDRITRPIIITDLVEYVREYINLIHDIPTLQEMLTFVKNDRGREEAMLDKHDDLVLAYAIALGSSSQQKKNLAAPTYDVSKLPWDLKEDYYKADAAQRMYLLKKWGIIKED